MLRKAMRAGEAWRAGGNDTKKCGNDTKEDLFGNWKLEIKLVCLHLNEDTQNQKETEGVRTTL
jgi:hypothetical protein